jgi:ketosteroid isomerase-like protein
MYSPDDIRNLAARYCDAVLRFDPACFASTWAEDAVWHVPGGQSIRGRDAIEAVFRETRARYALCIQELLSALIDSEGRARFTVRELQWRSDGEGTQLFGVYDDAVCGPADAPVFASRSFTLIYRGAADLSGRLHDVTRLAPF